MGAREEWFDMIDFILLSLEYNQSSTPQTSDTIIIQLTEIYIEHWSMEDDCPFYLPCSTALPPSL